MSEGVVIDKSRDPVDELISRVTGVTNPAAASSNAPVRVYDKYGFLESSDRASAGPVDKKLAKKEAELVNSRLKKWRAMIESWDDFYRKKYSKIKSRVRKGIPDGMRGQAWQLLGKSKDLPQKFVGMFEALVALPDTDMAEIIERDINRTFPHHVMFRERNQMGQASLFNVLKAYSVYDERVGYCQGMGFVAALLLMYMGEEEAFWLFVQLMKNYNMSYIYEPGLPQLQVYMYQFEALFKATNPVLFAHFDKCGVPVSMYASQWFMTNFLYSLPFETALRIWDCFLFDGIKIVFRVGLALLKLDEVYLLESDFEGVVMRISNYPKDKSVSDVLLPAAFAIDIKRQQLADLEAKYRREHMK